MSTVAIDATTAIPLMAMTVKVIGSALVGCEVKTINANAIAQFTVILYILSLFARPMD
jgi:hypothetical protein